MRQKKNIETDLVGDKLGRIHMGKQNLNNLQTRKMKGLKRGIEDVNGTDVDTVDEDLDSTANSKRVFIGDEVTA